MTKTFFCSVEIQDHVNVKWRYAWSTEATHTFKHGWVRRWRTWQIDIVRVLAAINHMCMNKKYAALRRDNWVNRMVAAAAAAAVSHERRSCFVQHYSENRHRRSSPMEGLKRIAVPTSGGILYDEEGDLEWCRRDWCKLWKGIYKVPVGLDFTDNWFCWIGLTRNFQELFIAFMIICEA